MNKLISNIKILAKHYRASTSILKQVLQSDLSLESSVKIVKERLRDREKNFLEIIEKTIFAYSKSPYRVLLEQTGCGFDDVKRDVGDFGIETTLKHLFDKGVYIDVLEFKGKKDTVRGGNSYRFKEKDFSNPLLTDGMNTKSGGTRSAGSNMTVPLEYIVQHNPYGVIATHVYEITKNPAIIWLPILPAGEGLFFNLRFTAMGNPPVKWFSQVDEKYINPPMMDKLKTKSTIWMARFYGKKMSSPEYVEIRNTKKIAEWMSENINDANGYSVVTYASSALRLILEAKKENLKLGRTVFWIMGEPLTDKISEEIEDYGCKAYSLYGCNEIMIIGHGCANPDQADDMHFCSDKLAVIQAKRKVEHSGLTVDAFFFTTLLKSSPKIFLNTGVGDYGILENRSCGCGFEKLGFSQHIHTIRSFEKLTAEGATFIGSDLIPLIQRTLPEEFGGNATDYQFIEEADENGIPKFFLLVSPDLDNIDEQRAKELVFDALTSEEYSHVYSRAYWTQADTFKIKRDYPIPTRRGKIIPLHIRSKLK